MLCRREPRLRRAACAGGVPRCTRGWVCGRGCVCVAVEHVCVQTVSSCASGVQDAVQSFCLLGLRAHSQELRLNRMIN